MCTHFVDKYYVRYSKEKGKNSGKTIKSRSVTEKTAIYEYLILCGFHKILPNRKINSVDIWKNTKLVKTDLTVKLDKITTINNATDSSFLNAFLIYSESSSK